VESPDTLHRKTIGLRIPKTDYPRFLALCAKMELTPTELARKAVIDYINRMESAEMLP
jgi:hypothetical protein